MNCHTIGLSKTGSKALTASISLFSIPGQCGHYPIRCDLSLRCNVVLISLVAIFSRSTNEVLGMEVRTRYFVPRGLSQHPCIDFWIWTSKEQQQQRVLKRRLVQSDPGALLLKLTSPADRRVMVRKVEAEVALVHLG